MSEKLEELKQEAAELGISHSPNIGEEKLQNKIDEYYKSKENEAPKIEIISEGEAPDTRSVSTGKELDKLVLLQLLITINVSIIKQLHVKLTGRITIMTWVHVFSH